MKMPAGDEAERRPRQQGEERGAPRRRDRAAGRHLFLRHPVEQDRLVQEERDRPAPRRRELGREKLVLPPAGGSAAPQQERVDAEQDPRAELMPPPFGADMALAARSALGVDHLAVGMLRRVVADVVVAGNGSDERRREGADFCRREGEVIAGIGAVHR